MSNTFPKDILDCMKGCILSIFWPKKDIIDFFKKSGCTQRELLSENVYKDLHRAEIVEKVFDNLEMRSDSGIGQFRSMLKRLTEWDYFDPYYFKKLHQLDERQAKLNISHLKQLQEVRDYKIKQERIEKEIEKAKKVIQVTEGKLANEKFVTRAPEHIVNIERDKITIGLRFQNLKKIKTISIGRLLFLTMGKKSSICKCLICCPRSNGHLNAWTSGSGLNC